MVFSKNQYFWMAKVALLIIGGTFIASLITSCKTIDVSKMNFIDDIMRNPSDIEKIIDKSDYYHEGSRLTRLKSRILKKWIKYIELNFSEGYEVLCGDSYDVKMPNGSLIKHIYIIGIVSKNTGMEIFFYFCKKPDKNHFHLCAIQDFDNRELDE